MYDNIINLETPESTPIANAFNVFKGSWAYKIPVEGVETGSMQTFDHLPSCISLMQKFYPNHANFDVLELGPHEGEQTFHLNKLVKHIDGVEGRSANFLKCLIVKNELPLERTHFMLADFMQYLGTTDKHWDLCYNTGVLYTCMIR